MACHTGMAPKSPLVDCEVLQVFSYIHTDNQNGPKPADFHHLGSKLGSQLKLYLSLIMMNYNHMIITNTML